MPHVRACLAQINTVVGDFDGNRARIERAVRAADKHGPGIILFPELTLTGYPPEDLLFKKNFVDGNLRALRSLLKSLRSRALIVLGFVDRDAEGRLYNAAAVLYRGKKVACYRKVELPNYGVFDEKRYFSSGERGLVVQCGRIRIGFSICEDIWRSGSFVYQAPYKGELSLHLNLSASPFHRNKQYSRESLLKQLARKNQAPVLYNNLVGGQDELVFDGGSSVVTPQGRLLGSANRFREELLFADIPVRVFNRPLSGASNADAVVLKARVEAAGRSRKGPRGTRLRRLSRVAEVYEALVLGTRDYIRKNGFNGVLIGLSGGIDSALVARIAVDALGPANVTGVTMPSRFTSRETLDDARKISKNLGIVCHEIPIEGPHETYLRVLGPLFAQRPPDSTEENLQARIRGTILMALSNKFGHLVLATGNKSELATGYCTLYGDMAGGFAVIKDVPKTLVYRLVRYCNELPPKNSIPASVIRRAPSAELRPGQKDQDTLPPYPLLDAILKDYVESDRSASYLRRKGHAAALVRSVLRRVDRNEYKRRQSPVGIKITPKAFGRDRRLPVTNRFSQ